MCRSPVILPPVVMRGTAAAVALVAALAGCSAEADPTPLPPLPSVSPTPETLQVPPEATPDTAEGAAAFAKYYLAVLEEALRSGEPGRLRELSDSGCGGCRNLIGAVERAQAAGQVVRGGEFVVLSAVSPAPEQGEAMVDLRYSREAGELVTLAGEVVEPIQPEPPIDAQMRVARAGTGWRVLGFRAVGAS
jgi:hypothetical protein